MARGTRFRDLFGPDPEGDVDDELSFHLEMRTRELVDRGESPEHARDAALERFGDYERSRRECIDIDERRKRTLARAEYTMEIRQDVAYALRTLRRAPGFTAVAVLTLALGIGATSAIFSVVHGVLLDPLPYRDAERLHVVRTLYPDGTAYTALSAPDFMSVREGNRVFESVEAYATGVFTLLGAGEPREVRGARVSDGLFDRLGMPLGLGRGFATDEHGPGRSGVVVLAHGFWQRAFGGDSDVLGRAVTVGGRSHTVVGVLAPAAALPAAVDVYAPLEYDETFSATTATGRRAEYLAVIGVARPGLGVTAIDEDLARLGSDLQQAFPETNATQTFNAASLVDLLLGDVRRPLFVLLGAVGLVLLVACANVANLLLARATARHEELAVRAALGAGRARLIRQLLTESAVLGFVGGVAGLGLAHWGTRALVAAGPADIPRLSQVGVDSTVVWFTMVIAFGTSLAFGALPAVQSAGLRLTDALRDGGRGGDGLGRGHRVRALLVVGEMALAVVLLTGAGLLMRSFVELTRVAPGFDAANAMTFRVTLQGDRYRDDPQIHQRIAELEQRLRALPRVRAVGAANVLPLGGLGSLITFVVEGAPPPPPDVNAEIAVASATPEYFRAVGASLRRGRAFTDRDTNEAPRVVVINEAAARRWFEGQDPVGRFVTLGDGPREVVGVVADIRQRHPGEPVAPQLFAPHQQWTSRSMRVVVRTDADAVELAPAIRAELRALDPDLALADLAGLGTLVDRSVERPRLYAALLTLFATVALALAATGIFGVTSYAVAQQAREISIRITLGAPPGHVVGSIVGRALALAAAGLAVGLAGGLVAGRALESQLFGITFFDPVTAIVVVFVLVAIAILASVLPARRAANVDPASLLR
jgi:putative ABC transport system permease protein